MLAATKSSKIMLSAMLICMICERLTAACRPASASPAAASARSLPRTSAPAAQGSAATAGGAEDRSGGGALFPTISPEEKRRKELTPLALRSLESCPDRIDANIGIPSDALVPILLMLIAGRFKFVVMRRAKFRYRSAKLHSFRIEMKLTEDDWPAEEGAAG
jgi:hypothetical protein